ncbi:MAG: hypothetical protein E7097_03730 [Bacteroides sp.]|nr:hypothetical protein [Bacteroides sp.]
MLIGSFYTMMHCLSKTRNWEESVKVFLALKDCLKCKG